MYVPVLWSIIVEPKINLINCETYLFFYIRYRIKTCRNASFKNYPVLPFSFNCLRRLREISFVRQQKKHITYLEFTKPK